jgi:hypothetical protein
MFGASAASIKVDRRHFTFRYRSPMHFLDVFRNYYGPTLKAFAALDEAMRVATKTGEAFFEPEAYRLRGEFMRQMSAGFQGTERASRLAAAESSIREALMMARKQGARSLALRAAMSLCLVQRDQRNGAEAEGSQLLARLFGSFTEGFDTPDLRDARTLLTELERVT